MKEKLKKVAVGAGTFAAAALPAVSVFAADAVDASTILTSAATTVQGNALSALGAVAPIGIAIGGTYLVLRLGWRFFKGLAK